MSLEDKYKRYLELVPSVQDEHGFVEWHECDSLLFTGLTGCVPELNINIDAAFDGEKWHRRPTDRPCFNCETKENTGSPSTISRDMLLGLAWYCYYNKRLDISEQVIKYAMANWGFMGCAEDLKTKWGRCQIGPGLFSTFCWISYRLGGPNRWWAAWIPADAGGHVKGYQAHLQILHILLRRNLTGKLSKSEKSTIKYQVARQPHNPLFLHADHRDMEAMEVLEREDLWPSDRLPRKADRKAQWLPMRDEGKDWQPELHKADLIPHSGGDFLFVWWLIGKRYQING